MLLSGDAQTEERVRSVFAVRYARLGDKPAGCASEVTGVRVGATKVIDLQCHIGVDDESRLGG